MVKYNHKGVLFVAFIGMVVLEALSAGVILIPLLLLLRKPVFHRPKNFIGYILFALYIAAVYSAVGLADISYWRYARWEPHTNWIPSIDPLGADTILNTAMFVPLGLLLPLLWRRYRSIFRTLLFGMGLSALIEFFQIFGGRATDINDFLTNTLGTVLGWAAAWLFLRCRSQRGSGQYRDAYLLCMLAALTMFFAQPYVMILLNQLFGI